MGRSEFSQTQNPTI
ncbi:hypothetical protein LINPERHAP1_LOCUS37995 [Linum perenne]